MSIKSLRLFQTLSIVFVDRGDKNHLYLVMSPYSDEALFIVNKH